MRNAKIAFKGIGTDSRVFALRLAAAKLFDRDANGVPFVSDGVESLTISFIGVGQNDKLQIEDIATLALVIRSLALSLIHI